MPYKDAATQREYMRAKMRQRRAAAKRQENAAVYPPVRPSQGNMPPVVIPAVRPESKGNVIPGALNTSAPMPAPMSPKRRLRERYAALRREGKSDAQAQALLTVDRMVQQETEKTRKAQEAYRQAIEERIPLFMEPARQWLLQNAGCFTPAMQQAKAREMAEHAVHMKQQPKAPDGWEWVQIGYGRNRQLIAMPATEAPGRQIAPASARS